MKQKNSSRKESKGKTVLLLAECWNGTALAGKFTGETILDKNTDIILLHTYLRPAIGVSMLRDIKQKIKNIAKAELAELKNRMILEYNIPRKVIQTEAMEGSLRTVLKREFNNYSNLSVVMGSEDINSLHNNACNRVVRTLLESDKRPLFLISDIITIVEKSRIVIIAEQKSDISSAFLDFLQRYNNNQSVSIEVFTGEKSEQLSLEEDTINLFSKNQDPERFRKNSKEHILREHLSTLSPCV